MFILGSICNLLFIGVIGKLWSYYATDIDLVHGNILTNSNQLDNLYVSPQPFIIPDDEYIFIKKLISGSNVKVMTINGYVVRKFNLGYNENIIKWDGRDNFGQLLFLYWYN